VVSETTIAEKLSFRKYTDHSFFAVFGCDGGLYSSFLNKVDRVRRFALDKNVLIFL